MMRKLAIAIAIAFTFASPAMAQQSPAVSSRAGTTSIATVAVDPNCPPEHAEMGHCTPSTAANVPKPVASPVVDPNCPPEHAEMGHCTPSTAATVPKALAAPAIDPKCPPEHATMGHCTPATGTKISPQTGPIDPSCPPEHAAAGHCVPAAGPPRTGPSAAALSGPEYAADSVWGADVMVPVRRSVYAEHGTFRGSRVLLDRFEYHAQNGGDGYAWEGEAWYGGDYNRLWLKTEGEGAFGQPIESAEVQALWSRALDPWFNLQAGVRYDIGRGPDRAHLALGVQGVAPYLFEVDIAAFLSDRGDFTARIEAEYDQRITNQLILQPRLEINLAAQDIVAAGIGAGLSTGEAGLRLRYEFVPEFAPYLGVEYHRSFGKTADFARAEGERVDGLAFVIGLRAWF